MNIDSEHPPTGPISPSECASAHSGRQHRERIIRAAIERLHAVAPSDDVGSVLADRLRKETSAELNALLLEQLGLGGNHDGPWSAPDERGSLSQD